MNYIMKHIILTTLLALFAFAARAEKVYYGYAPYDTEETNMALAGTNSNNFMQIAARFDAFNDLTWLRMAGGKVVGVRVFLRADYKQRKKEWSCVSIYQGSLDSEPQEKYVDFTAGWNEVLFDEPVSIGTSDIYIGAQVFETLGTPMPFATYSKTACNGGFYTRSSYGEWLDYSSRGVALIQAIVETNNPGALKNAAYLSFSNLPLVVGPDQEFSCSLYVHNQSQDELRSINYMTTDGTVSHDYTIDFGANPIPAYGSRLVNVKLYGPSKVGTEVSLSVKPTKFNGQPAAEGLSYTGQLYVMKDAFIRVPLVEEFTSQFCVNCPFMAYFLDKAIENHDGPLLYVAHHSGFTEDTFTKPCDNELLYLFKNDNGTFNPAVMYDRRVGKGEVSPIHTAQVAETQPYDDAINAAALYPAMAQVYVDTTYTADGKLKVRVCGAVNRSYYEEDIPVYLSCYLCESGIPTVPFFQYGLDDEGAPADLAENFRHNGVIRHCYSKKGTGDRIDITPTADDTYEFSVEYEGAEIDRIWKMQNCDVIAFLHLYDKDDMNYNYVLNAGSVRINDMITVTGIKEVKADNRPGKVWYDLTGRRIAAPAKGISISGGRKVIR